MPLNSVTFKHSNKKECSNSDLVVTKAVYDQDGVMYPEIPFCAGCYEQLAMVGRKQHEDVIQGLVNLPKVTELDQDS